MAYGRRWKDQAIQDPRIRLCHTDEQNRVEDGNEDEIYSRDDEGQHVFLFQSLSPD